MADIYMDKVPEKVMASKRFVDFVKTYVEMMNCPPLSDTLKSCRCEACGSGISYSDKGNVFMPDAEGHYMEWTCGSIKCDCKKIYSMTDAEMVSHVDDMNYKFRVLIDTEAINKTWGKDNG